jgi:hypothetical protein
VIGIRTLASLRRHQGEHMREPAQPFRFSASLNLTLATNRRARDVAELLHHVREMPGAAMYFHTHHFLAQHQHLSPEPTNDFAYWITTSLQEDRLGEQLAAIDIVQFRSLGALRDRIAGVLETFLESSQTLRTAPAGEEFHVRESVTFVVPSGYIANDLEEFASALERVGLGSLNFHIFDARLHLERGSNDFSEWLTDAQNEPALAEAIARLDPYTHTLEGLRRQIVRLVRRRLTERVR